MTQIWDDLAFRQRFDAKVGTRGDACWPWTGAQVRGRGTIDYYGRMLLAPRLAKVIADRAWPHDGLQACHSCDNPNCVNPAHIWWGTGGDNTRDAARKGRLHFQKRATCINGHPLSGENLRVTGGRRVCRECAIARQRRWRERSEQNPVGVADAP